MTTYREDINGQLIGGYESETSYHIEDFGDLPIAYDVEKAISTESVYVRYWRTDDRDREKVTVRFSWHTCNGIRFGLYVDGESKDARNEILYRLGFKKRRIVPIYTTSVGKEFVGKKRIKQFVECDKTIEEIESLPEGADLSDCCGKLAKGTNILIKNDHVRRVQTAYNRAEYYD